MIYAVLPGPDYAGALLFFFANGKAARVDLTAYKTTSNRRKLTGAYSDKAPLACIRRLDAGLRAGGVLHGAPGADFPHRSAGSQDHPHHPGGGGDDPEAQSTSWRR